LLFPSIFIFFKSLHFLAMGLTAKEEDEAIELLRQSVLLRRCTEAQLRKLAKGLEKKTYKKGDILSKEGEPQTKMFILANGSAVREKSVGGQIHQIDTHMGGYTVGSLHIMNKDPSFATTRCFSDVTAYELSSDYLNSLFAKDSQFAFNVAYSLTMEIRSHTKNQRTPLLQQHPKATPIYTVTIAAGVESFYRSALNALLNQHLTGVKMVSLFPNMHIQMPTRIIYINGIKGLRTFLDTNVNPENYDYPKAIRLGVALAPGITMTPISSILEATHAGHSNPEPMYTRWTRGLVPRTGREIIFGVGLNQLSDYCEERVPVFENPALRNAAGSLTAGVVSGYLSHVVHNLSTLKLMNPHKSYSQHFSEYCKKAESRVPANLSPSWKRVASTTMACLFPTGVTIRTSQIVGTFIILNGTINAISRWANRQQYNQQQQPK